MWFQHWQHFLNKHGAESASEEELLRLSLLFEQEFFAKKDLDVDEGSLEESWSDSNDPELDQEDKDQPTWRKVKGGTEDQTLILTERAQDVGRRPALSQESYQLLELFP